MIDVIIVGAGPAGLEASLVLARAGRSVVTIDGGPGRNAPSGHAHNVFTRDGTSPDELRRIGRAQAEGYGARFLEGQVTDASADEDGVRVTLADGSELTARKLLLATGVHDHLAEVPGVVEAWGDTVAHCPYCHGHELRGRPTVVLASGEQGAHLAGLLLGWTDDVCLCSGPDGVSAEERERLEAIGVRVEERIVASLEVAGREVRAVVLEDGERVEATAVYIQTNPTLAGSLPDTLGLERTESGLAKVDDFMRTSVPNVSACGDMTTPMQAVQMAASAGFGAAAFLNHELVSEGARYVGG